MTESGSTNDNGWGWFVAAVVGAFVVVGYFGGGPFSALEPEKDPTPFERVVERQRAANLQRLSPTTSPPVYFQDLDCSDFYGPVDVSLGDPHGLDADGDGWGCE